MSDNDEMTASRPADTAAAGSSLFAPGVLVRLQYAGYLFVGLVLSLVLKGTAGHALDGISFLRHGCEFMSHPFLPATGGSPAPSSDETSLLLNTVCFGNTLVYRISFSLALFFLIHYASVSDLTCCIDAASRAAFQTRFFCVKTALVMILFSVSMSIPNSFFAVYAWLCMFVSAVFLVIQMVLMVDFSYQWNDDWGERSETNSKWQWYLVLIAGGSYLTGLVVCIAGYVYFVPHSDCNFNAFAITAVLISGLLNTIIAIWVPHGSIVPSGIVFAYCAVLQFSNLRNTKDAYCNTMHAEASDMKSIVMAAIFSGCVLAYSVVSTSASSSSLSLEEGADEEDPDVVGHLSKYCFFYAIMMAGSMYLAMLASDWSVSGSSSGDSSSMVAFWVKNSTIWLTMSLYMWTLLAPYFCCKDREFGFQTDDW